ncbi:MAG: ABC transporter substrate-binding protein, partial [Rhodovibrionaceae bacterium]
LAAHASRPDSANYRHQTMIDTLWFTRCPAPTPASIAIRNGWLRDEFAPDGIEVLSLAASREKSVHLSHYRHTQPNSFRFGGYVPPLISCAQGRDVKIVGLGWPDRTAEIVVPEDSDIHSGGGLAGKRLGVPLRLNDTVDWWRATVQAGYEDALQRLGFGPGDVEFVNIDIAREYVADIVQGEHHDLSLWGARSQFAVQREEAAAMIRGEVDALYTDAAMGAILKAAYGFRPVMSVGRAEDEEEGVSGHPTVLTVSGTLLEERPDLVERWIGRLLDAESWCLANEEEAVRILARDTGVPEDFLAPAYSARVQRQMDVSLSPKRIALLQAKQDHLLRHGFIAQPIDLETAIDARPLNAALQHRRHSATGQMA